MLLRTLWMRTIVEQLFANNAFLLKSLDWNEYVNAGLKTVVIPQAGTAADFEVNRTVFPATITTRADGDIQYDMNDYTTNPRLVKNLEQKQLSYDKMASEVRLMLGNVRQGVALDVLYSWRPELAGQIIETTGAAKATTLAGSTGNRKAITYADVVAAATLLDNQDVDSEGRQLLLPANLYNQLVLDADVKQNFNTKLADLSTGVLGHLCGFEVMKRSSVLKISDSGVTKTRTAAVAVTDSQACLFWHPDWVGRSVGNEDVIIDPQPRPEYYGRIMSSQLQAGGSKVSATGVGVGAIRPANV